MNKYNNQTITGFLISSLVWGVVGILLGLLCSLQLGDPEFNFGAYFSYGRLRTIHIDVLSFGLGLGAIFGLFYYMTEKLTKTALVCPRLTRVHLIFFNILMVVTTATLFAGMNQSNEYAEFEWWVDILWVILWVIFAVSIFATIIKRKEKHMYVSIWYILASIIAIAVLFIVNNLAVPASIMKSYPLFVGMNSANVQWWYGHNIVGFLLTTPILAIFYYFLPVSSGLPIYSHRLSMVSFWALIFTYLWTGAHHLIYSPLPDWIQTVSIVFSLFLIAPSWGSVLNGYFTVESDWSKLRTHYLTKFFLVAITLYGLQTIQGPAQAIRVISSLVHFTDWVPGHVHMGTMGWVALTLTAAMYHVFPKIYGTTVYSIRLANIHFWLVFIAQLMYSTVLWASGVVQWAMLKMTNSEGTLAYTFMDTLEEVYIFLHLRTISGVIFTIGMVIFIVNISMTIVKGKRAGGVA